MGGISWGKKIVLNGVLNSEDLLREVPLYSFLYRE